MPLISGAEVLVASLAAEGVDVVFGLPGVQIMDAVDAIYREKSTRWISTRHEQTAAYMAYSYARTTDKIGVAMVLPNPGPTALTITPCRATSLASAWANMTTPALAAPYIEILGTPIFYKGVGESDEREIYVSAEIVRRER